MNKSLKQEQFELDKKLKELTEWMVNVNPFNIPVEAMQEKRIERESIIARIKAIEQELELTD